MRDLFAEGAMSAAFVPTFTRHLTLGGKRDAWRLGNNVLNALLVVTGVVVLIAGVSARPLVQSLAHDFGDVPGKIELTVHLTRVLLPFLTLVAIAAAAMGMLNSLHHYFLPALSPAMFNIATIACGVALVPLMPRIGEPRIMAIAIGALIGGVGQVALQWPSLRREGFRYAPVIDLRDPGLQQVLLLMGPGTVGLAATQVNIFVNTLLATSQGTGAVSWMTYAFRLMYLPIGLFGVSIGTAVLPAVSRHAAVRRHRRHPSDRVARARPDADAQRARNGRAVGAGNADRPAAVRARPFPGVRHNRDRGGAALLRSRAGRILGRADRLADFLRDRAQPDCP